MKRIFRGNLTPRKLLVALVLVTTALGGTVLYAQAARSTTTYRTAQVVWFGRRPGNGTPPAGG
jgi:hypothetical protein